MTWSVRLGVTLVRGYQLLLSPFSGGTCRFHPTCSVYAMEALTAHGLARGSWLALKRVSRCHPFARPGFDPVPPRVG
ncbi:MAG TPA: membrane protein insertion efficiency factor YidD [Vicinamibacterales bacterium]